jgi:hypothetical protein
MAGGDPSEPLQRAVYAALVAAEWPDDVLGAGTDTDPVRVFDKPLPTHTDGRQITGNTVPEFPFVQIGEAQVIGDFADCIDASEVFFDVHVWSRKTSLLQAKAIGSVVRAALHGAEPALAGFTLVDLRFEDARYLRDPDGITRHGVLSFKALISAS